ncbi:MAG: hypothetical protein FD130_1703 [Halothiobacillaceae bacterium]|nr:MAG: hypothetical protein FD130_1703 [Halothiobacillaceae bacterium]
MTSTATDHPSLPDKTLSRVLLRLLSALRKTPVGDTIYQHVEIMLNRHESAQQELTLAHVQLLTSLLNTVISRLHENSPLQVQLKLMLLHLVPPLSIAEIKTLTACLESINVEMAQEVGSLDSLLMPVATAFNPPQQMDTTSPLNNSEPTWPTKRH